MRSAFLFSPEELSQTCGAVDLVHVSCIPYLCGAPLPEKGAVSGKNSPKLLLSFPFISKGGAYRRFCSRFEEFAAVFDGFTIQNIGDYETLCDLLKASRTVRREDLFVAGDVSLNVTNTASASFWYGKLDSAAILPELSFPEQEALASECSEGLMPEIIVSSRAVVMRSEHCFAARGGTFKCGRCGKFGLSGGGLFDVGGKEFPVITNPVDCNSLLLCPVEPGSDLKETSGPFMYRIV